ncbi:MAG TPA: hypothetical protein VNA12_08985 [Mycobacteriales bacterium]|nr:hypothetical protein [Mycobacteriales bacterium]
MTTSSTAPSLPAPRLIAPRLRMPEDAESAMVPPDRQRTLAAAALTAFRAAAGTPRPRPLPGQLRAVAIAAQILEVAPPAPPAAVPATPPDYVPKPHSLRRRRRT